MIIVSRWSGSPHKFQDMDYCVPEIAESRNSMPIREKILKIIVKVLMGKALKEAEKKARKKKEQLGPGSRVIIALEIGGEK